VSLTKQPVWRVLGWGAVFLILIALCVHTWRGTFVKPPKTGPHVSAVLVKNVTGASRDIQIDGDGMRLMAVRLGKGEACLLLFSPPTSAPSGSGKFLVRAFVLNGDASNDVKTDVFSLVSFDYRKDGVWSDSTPFGDWTMPKGSKMFYFRDAAYKEIDVHMSPEIAD